MSVEMDGMNKNLRIVVGNDWQPKLLPYFAMALMAFMLITNILNLKFIDVAGVSVIGSMLVYVFSLIVTDIMAEVYGYRRVRRVLWVGLGFLVLYAVSIHVAVVLEPAKDYLNNEIFRVLFGQAPRIAIASIAAYIVSELINSFIMSRLKVKLHAKYFYGRATLAVGMGQIINGIIFYGIAFAGVLSLNLVLSSMISSWLMVMVCEIVILPFTKHLAIYVKNYEGAEYFDWLPEGLVETL